MRTRAAPDSRSLGTSVLSYSGAVEPLKFGMYRNSFSGHVATWLASKIKVDRGENLEWGYLTAENITKWEAAVKISIEAGCTPIVTISVSQELLSKVNAKQYGEKVKALVKVLEEKYPHKCTYELINEPYFCGPKTKSNAVDYANIIKEAYTEVESLALGYVPTLLVAGFLTYEKVDALGEKTGVFSDYTGGNGWIHDIGVQWAAGKTKINGWTSHPYGEPKVATSGEGNNNIRAASTQHTNAVENGMSGTSNWWVTEFGYSIGAGGFGKVATEAEQATKLKEACEEFLTFWEQGWLKAICVFTDHEGETWDVWSRAATKANYKAFAEAHG